METLTPPGGIRNSWITGKSARAICGGIAILAILAATWPGPARAIITSDGEGTHVVTPGVPVFGVNLDGVVRLDYEGLTAIGLGTGILISDTHVLTVAHEVREGPFFRSVRFNLADGVVHIPIVAYAVHPDYDPATVANDLAVLELAFPAPAAAPRYELYTGSDEVGKTVVVAGYGQTGSGATGGSVTDGAKRAGLNRIDATGQDVADLGGYPAGFDSSILLFDFDSGLPANDFTTLFGAGDTGFGDDEVGLSTYDFGGPCFIEVSPGVFHVAAVTSVDAGLSQSFTSFDWDSQPRNGSWGEVFRTMRVSTAIPFIQSAMTGTGMRRQRVFNDGGVHVEENTVEETLIRIEDSPAPGGQPTTLTFGAGASAASTEREEMAVRILDNSAFVMNSGQISGYPAIRVDESGHLTVNGGTIVGIPNTLSPIFSNSIGIRANQNSTVAITGGTLSGDETALAAIEQSMVSISGGDFNGGVHAVRINSSASISGGNFQSPQDGIMADGSASLAVTGGTIQGDDNAAALRFSSTTTISDGEFIGGNNGLRTFENAVVTLTGGSFTSASVGLRATDDSAVNVGGGLFSGQFALWALDQAKIHITDGVFTGGLNDIRLEGSSVAVIDGGTFNGGGGASMAALGQADVTVNGGSYAGTIAGRATGEASVAVTGGSFTGSSYAFLVGDQATTTLTGGDFQGGTDGLVASDSANVTIRGGTFTALSFDGLYASGDSEVSVFGGSFNGVTNAIFLDESAVVRIYAYGFNLPLGSMANSTVTLTGTYFDGTPFVHTIDVTDASELELVSGYDAWAAFHGLEGDDALFSADANGNGIPNALELVFGGNPASGGATQAIETSSVRKDHGSGEQEYLKITHPVTEMSIDLGEESFIEYGADLTPGSWTVAAHGVDGVVIVHTPDGYAPGIHKIEAWIPKVLAPGGRLFARVGVAPL